MQPQIDTRIPGPTPFGSAGWYGDNRFKNAFLAAYTWSKALDEGASGWFAAENGASQGNAALQDFYDPKSSKGPSGYDVPHFVSFSGIYELPFGRGKPIVCQLPRIAAPMPLVSRCR